MENNSPNHIDIPISENIGGGRRGSRTSPLPPILPQNDVQQPPLLQHLHSEISSTKKKIGVISALFTLGGKNLSTPKPRYNKPQYSEFCNIANKTQLPS